MTLPILIDMSLSREWQGFFARHGLSAVHWSAIGAADDEDVVIFEWAHTNKMIVFTNDLDFGTQLALLQTNGPSVIQVRTANVLPESIGDRVLLLLQSFSRELEEGALIVLDAARDRVRMLPLN